MKNLSLKTVSTIFALSAFMVHPTDLSAFTSLHDCGLYVQDGAVQVTVDDSINLWKTEGAKLFEDNLFTKLRRGVGKSKIRDCKIPEMQRLALAMRGGKYDLHFRVNSFKPLYTPETLGRLLHIGNGYSRFQQVTGIVVSPGKNIIIVDGLKTDTPLHLKVADLYAPDQGIADWSLHTESYELHNGVNIIEKKTQWSGLAYIDYYFDRPELENEIKVHFVNSSVNGYFDSSLDSDADWDMLLSKAVYPVFDAVGEHVHLAYPVEDFKKYASGKGRELMSAYDEIVANQYEILGWKKYGRIPDNKIFARVNYSYYMFRDGNGVAFKFDTMNRVADPEKVRRTDEDVCWGFSHEIGHVHQLSPYLSWGGLGETSNNICSRYCTQAFGYPNRLNKAFSEAEKNFLHDGMAGSVSKARTAGGMTDSIISPVGQNGGDKALSYLEVDVFQRLVPFWKLQCYYVKHGMPDFYPDLYERMRNTEKLYPVMAGVDRHANVVPFQLNFIRGASFVAGKNLYPYFEAFGFFRILRLKYDDYGMYTYEMTESMRDAFRAEMEGYVKSGKLADLTSEELEAMLNAQE